MEVSLVLAEVEPVGAFVGLSVSEPVLQGGIVAGTFTYMLYLNPLMAALALGGLRAPDGLRPADAAGDQPPRRPEDRDPAPDRGRYHRDGPDRPAGSAAVAGQPGVRPQHWASSS
ncbi:hypothetical protein ACU4GR_02505 [Methylobacterium oryzae CBMB20]